MMMVQSTEQTAERWSKQRLAPMIEDCPSLRKKIPPARSRDSGNTTLLKEWPGGLLVIAGSNSGAGLRSMPACYLVLDEVDAYPLEIENEGDPVAIAEGRTTTFPRRKAFLLSTPTIESLSRINKEWMASDQRHYHVACPHCGQEQTLEWENLHWTKGQPKEAVYHCSGCGVGIEEHHKTQMLADGKWIPTYLDRDVPGFHINALYNAIGLGLSWAELAELWEASAGDPAKEKAFRNLRLGLVTQDPNEKIDPDDLKSRAGGYQLREIPPGCLILTAGVDVQKDRFAIMILGFGRGRQMWIIDYVELPSDPTTEAAWVALDEHLVTSIPNSRGIPMRIRMAAIDSGYLTDHVLAYTRGRRSRAIAVKGASTQGKPVINKPSKLDVTINGRTIKHGAEGWLVGADTAKVELFTILASDGKRDHDHERALHFPDGLDESFYNSLTAEVWDPKKRQWVKIRPRNEALDTWCYALAASRHPALRVHLAKESQWAQLEAVLEPQTMDLFAAAQKNDEPAPGALPAPKPRKPEETFDPQKAAGEQFDAMLRARRERHGRRTA